MMVWYVHRSTDGGVTQAANILWNEKYPMRTGEFPPDHPCVDYAAAFAAFKTRGYWANSFPEGDGITLDLKKDQTAEQVVKDIEDCFGWEVLRGLGDRHPRMHLNLFPPGPPFGIMPGR